MFDYSLALKADREKREHWERKRKETLKRVTQELRTFFADIPVQKVYLVGSLTQPDRYRPRSDIDIAVEGLPPEIYLKTLADLNFVLGTDHIDLIEMERCSFAESIRDRGLRII